MLVGKELCILIKRMFILCRIGHLDKTNNTAKFLQADASENEWVSTKSLQQQIQFNKSVTNEATDLHLVICILLVLATMSQHPYRHVAQWLDLLHEPLHTVGTKNMCLYCVRYPKIYTRHYITIYTVTRCG